MRVFVSYAWESEAYRRWVLRLGIRLRSDGIDARLDHWQQDGASVPEYMNREVRQADKILVLCSPQYRRRVHAAEDQTRTTGSGWEAGLIGAGLFVGALSKRQVVVALGLGTWVSAARAS